MELLQVKASIHEQLDKIDDPVVLAELEQTVSNLFGNNAPPATPGLLVRPIKITFIER